MRVKIPPTSILPSWSTPLPHPKGSVAPGFPGRYGNPVGDTRVRDYQAAVPVHAMLCNVRTRTRRTPCRCNRKAPFQHPHSQRIARPYRAAKAGFNALLAQRVFNPAQDRHPHTLLIGRRRNRLNVGRRLFHYALLPSAREEHTADGPYCPPFGGFIISSFPCYVYVRSPGLGGLFLRRGPAIAAMTGTACLAMLRFAFQRRRRDVGIETRIGLNPVACRTGGRVGCGNGTRARNAD